MKRQHVLVSLLAALAIGCTPNHEKMVADIQQSEQNLTAYDVVSDDAKADRLIAQYRAFASAFPDDSLAPVYLTRVADVCINIGREEQAIGLLDSIVSLYPGYEDIGGCYFLKGIALEHAGRYEEAVEACRYFVDNYPGHDQAASTRQLLDNGLIGASQEQLQEYLMRVSNNQDLEQ